MLNVAVFFGGYSSEYSISLQSAYAVICNLDPKKYHPLPIGISREGRWFFFRGDLKKIPEDTWCNDGDCVPALLSPNRGEKALYLLTDGGIASIPVDVALPIMHGKFGEDGTLQGYIELAGIPLVGCGVLSSALCMDKDRAHKLAELAGILVPRALALRPKYSLDNVLSFAKENGYPLFVKPVKSGSSYGVTRVECEEQLLKAVDFAFTFDNEVLIEQGIEGFEVGCAVMGSDELIVGEVDEIELAGGFFDFTEKYTLKTSAIHVPARISKETAERIKETAKILYRTLACTGFARVDLFLTPDEKIYFNEINTIPGFTEHSRYPGMMRAIGYSFPQVLDKLIDDTLKK
ncbi:MAG: D-alanine--D-serine ligase VanG [Clostridia bacterium]|nr:D-alanine--D-serine ligase VanG [Clostridia bacterium]